MKMMGIIGKVCLLWLTAWQILSVWQFQGAHGQNLQVGFYGLTCPTAEAVVTKAVTQAFLLDNTIGASLIRLMFHDCFVEGCDASILLTGVNSEQVAVPNLSVRGYGVISNIKVQLESACPGIVSCADIVVLAARDAVGLLGGPVYTALTGRLDGLAPGIVTLPNPTDGVEASTPIFANVGLSQPDMVTLLGAHSVGTSQCQFLSNRLYNFNNTGLPDPTLNATYLATLQAACPLNGTGLSLVPLDHVTEFVLDTTYYQNVRQGQGILVIDQEISQNLNTSAWVQSYAGLPTPTVNETFSTNFAAALNKLSSIGPKTSLNGEVRLVCEVVN